MADHKLYVSWQGRRAGRAVISEEDGDHWALVFFRDSIGHVLFDEEDVNGERASAALPKNWICV